MELDFLEEFRPLGIYKGSYKKCWKTETEEQGAGTAWPCPSPQLSCLALKRIFSLLGLYPGSGRACKGSNMPILWEGGILKLCDLQVVLCSLGTRSCGKQKSLAPCPSSSSPQHEERHEFCHTPCYRPKDDRTNQPRTAPLKLWTLRSYVKYLLQQQNTNTNFPRKYVKS